MIPKVALKTHSGRDVHSEFWEESKDGAGNKNGFEAKNEMPTEKLMKAKRQQMSFSWKTHTETLSKKMYMEVFVRGS